MILLIELLHILHTKNVDTSSNILRNQDPFYFFGNFSSENKNCQISHFAKAISKNLWLWWQMTREPLQSCDDWKGQRFHLWRSLLRYIFLSIHTDKDTNVTCVAEAVSLWLLAEDESRSRLLRWPFNLHQLIPLSQLCSSPAWRRHRKMAVIHLLVGSSSGFLFFAFFHPLKFSWAFLPSFLHSIVSCSPQFSLFIVSILVSYL